MIPTEQEVRTASLYLRHDQNPMTAFKKAVKWTLDYMGVNGPGRYPMCKDQLAQIDCRNIDCEFHDKNGNCLNISPAITLNETGTFICWSTHYQKPEGNG